MSLFQFLNCQSNLLHTCKDPLKYLSTDHNELKPQHAQLQLPKPHPIQMPCKMATRNARQGSIENFCKTELIFPMTGEVSDYLYYDFRERKKIVRKGANILISLLELRDNYIDMIFYTQNKHQAK